ncbi:hypothetical protein [Nitrosomonas sp. Nm132]|jgi:hypothetical protein|uniref:hypothetical protein n=1 Tax=Nitrosomonas sp. Nm132 TaxID=1881053 RepID=UPI000886B828|nr:hypothetical protein [Nitrosomonas sp. Nm132]SDI08559.1 hypothetical protein SAMN05428952_10761 [Nitrosomonas sp. Nm132]
MARPLKYPKSFPFYTAINDLSSSLALYRYTEYGLLIREKLEIEGPYAIPDSYFTAWREHGGGSRSGLVLSSNHSDFDNHKKTILTYARNQFLVNAFSIFEFFIANTVIFIWAYCDSKSESKKKNEFIWKHRDEIRECNKNLKFIWSEEKKTEFLESPAIANIEDDEWMMDNYRTNEQKKRIQLLENVCGLNIRDFNTVENGISCDWKKFKSYERLRNNIAHTAGRNSLYINNGLVRKEITKDEILNIFWFIHNLIGNLNEQIYTSGIFHYEHQIPGSAPRKGTVC